MTDQLRDVAERLRIAQAHVLGALDAAVSLASSARDASYKSAHRERERQQAIVRNLAAQAVTENSIRARDVAASLRSAGSQPLDASEYISLGRLTTPGGSFGINADVEVPLVVPLLGRSNIIVEAEPSSAHRIVECIVWEALAGTAPGQLDIVGYDPRLSGALAPFSPLRRVSDEALRVLNRATDLERAVQQLVADVQRVNDTMRGAGSSLVEFRRAAGHPVERYQLVVLLDYPADVDEQLHRQVLALAGAGAPAGVSVVFVAPPAGSSVPDWWREGELAPFGTLLREERGALRWIAHPSFRLTLPEGDTGTVARAMDELAFRASSAAVPRIPFSRVQPLTPTWGASSADRLQFAIGLNGPAVAEVTLGDEQDQRHNILITGAVGQGKSNLLKVIIHSLAQRYSPDELEMYLLDFKEGVTLYPMAPTPGAPDFLPQARVLGLESDRDFGLAVLRHVEAEFSRRAKIFRPYGDSIGKYRAAVPDAVMPRILVIIDEFHMLFDPNDATAEQAAQLLEAISRRGRSYGVHLVLASQTISGVAALMTREGGIFAQFPIRLALKNAIQESYATLGQGNDAAARLRVRGEAVLNLDYGHIDSNRQVVIAAADDAELGRLRHGWWEATRDRVAAPLVFDGSRRPRVADAIRDLRALRARAVARGGAPAALLGYPIDVSGTPLSIPFGAEPGRNLAVLGAGEAASHATVADDAANTAVGVLQSAAISLALQHPGGDAEFVSFELLDDDTFRRSNQRAWLDTMVSLGYPVEQVDRDAIPGYLQALAAGLESRDTAGPALYLLGFGLDRATTLDAPDMFAHRASEDLQQVLRSGPSKRIHLLGWWANAATFRSHIGFGGEGFIDAMLMLRIDQSTVQEVLSSPFITWSVKDNRGLLADRTQLPEPTTIIPFSPLTARGASQLAQTDWEV